MYDKGMHDEDNWFERETRPGFEQVTATRNGIIQVGWIHNTVDQTIHLHYDKGQKFYFMLGFVVSGTATIHYYDGATVTIPPNSLSVTNPYRQRSDHFISPGEHESYMIIIPPLFYDTVVASGLLKPDALVLPAPKDFNWKPRLSMLAEELMNCKSHMLPAFVGRLYSEICEVLAKARNGASPERSDTLQQIADLLSQSQGSRLSLGHIADRFGMTLRTMERQFLDAFGVTPKEFRIARRMETAVRILRDSKESKLSDIAANLGYSNPFSFSRQFKDTFGVSPSEYRTLKGWGNRK